LHRTSGAPISVLALVDSGRSVMREVFMCGANDGPTVMVAP